MPRKYCTCAKRNIQAAGWGTVVVHEHINTYITESFVGLCTHSSVELHTNILHVVRLGGGGG